MIGGSIANGVYTHTDGSRHRLADFIDHEHFGTFDVSRQGADWRYEPFDYGLSMQVRGATRLATRADTTMALKITLAHGDDDRWPDVLAYRHPIEDPWRLLHLMGIHRPDLQITILNVAKATNLGKADDVAVLCNVVNAAVEEQARASEPPATALTVVP